MAAEIKAREKAVRYELKKQGGFNYQAANRRHSLSTVPRWQTRQTPPSLAKGRIGAGQNCHLNKLQIISLKKLEILKINLYV